MRIVITGVPGTGKSTLARSLARELGCKAVHANDLVKGKNLWLSKKEGTVDLAKLRRALLLELAGQKSWVAEGHLLCEFAIPCDKVLVLRCEPAALKARLVKRRYSQNKVRENLWAELLDYCVTRAEDEYGSKKVIQVDNTRFHSAHASLDLIRRQKGEKTNWSNWLRSPSKLGSLLGRKAT